MHRYEQGERKVTWVELFFDLVFVAGAHQVAVLLKDGFDIAYIFIFLLLLWIWLGHTLFTTRFESYGWLSNTLTILTMAGSLALVLQIKGALGPYLMTFAFTYAALRIILILQYLSAALKYFRRFVWVIPTLVLKIVTAGLWVYSPFSPFPVVIWAIALGIDVLIPIITKPTLSKVSVHTRHLPERLGLLTVVMLGEMIIAITSAAQTEILDQRLIIFTSLGIIITTIIFWIYFRFIEKEVMASNKSNWLIYLYAHLMLYVSLVCLAAGLKSVIQDHPATLLIVTGIFLFVCSFRAIRYLKELRIQRRQLVLFLIFLPIVVVYGFIGASMEYSILMLALFAIYLIISDFILAQLPDWKQQNQVLDWTQGRQN